MTSNLTSGFIDLATFDELEKYFYGGAKATTYFVRKTRKSSWFTQVPVALSGCGGTRDFNQEWSTSVSRAGDYMMHNWLRVTLPSVQATGDGVYGDDTRVRWCRNLMHNLVEECSIMFNDLVEARFDSAHLDFWSAFTVPEGKRLGYDNMIGNISILNNPSNSVGPNLLPSVVLNLPLPFPHTRDTGVAMPTAALPYNEMRIVTKFRSYLDLLVVDDNGTANLSKSASANEIVGTPALTNVQMWANYAIVSNAERVKMGAAPRDIAIEQVQSAPMQNVTFGGATSTSRDLRLSHAVKVIFFAMRNTTVSSDRSNYTSSTVTRQAADTLLDFTFGKSGDPIATTSLLYENTTRLNAMGSDYFSLIQPYYQCRSFTIPASTGYHMYSYSLDLLSLDPMGSTNFGKLTNISMTHTFSQDAIDGAAGGTVEDGHFELQKFQTVATVVNNNVVRVSGGALGFPVL
jgi:hypothetical protein